MKDATIKKKHFISPLSLYGKRTADAPPAPPAARKGGKKGSKKGGAKGTKGQPHTWQSGKGSSRTPDNKPICFRYNAKGGCKKGAKCHFTHVCSICFGPRPDISALQRAARLPIRKVRLTPDLGRPRRIRELRHRLHQWQLGGP